MATKRDAEGVEEDMSRLGLYHLSQTTRKLLQLGLGRTPDANDFGHYRRNFVGFHACLVHFGISAARLTQPTRSHHLCQPASRWFGGSTRVPCAPPIWIRPWGPLLHSFPRFLRQNGHIIFLVSQVLYTDSWLRH